MTTDPPASGNTEQSLRPFGAELVALAEASIDHGLARGQPMEPDLAAVSAPLQAQRASFVTLRRAGELRGCIGTLEAHRPLAQDIATNAFGAAFRDPRFPPLQADERETVTVKIEVLTVPAPLAFDDEASLLAQLVPGEDGLLLEAGGHKGTFLPTVWAHLPEPEQFWTQLKRKAGLPADYFSPDMRVYRYRTEVLP
jgi:hypothetical protein